MPSRGWPGRWRWRPVAEVGAGDVMEVTFEILERLREWLAMDEGARAGRTVLQVFKRKAWELERGFEG